MSASRGSAESAAHALIGEVLAGRYRVERLLGSGGMGSVYRAEHVHMRKAVAIKVLHREMTYLPEVVARFEREAVAAARIEHPNVAAATDFGRLDNGAFYLVLEYVEGQSLRALLKQEKQLSSVRALHIARQIADALAAAHQAGIVHRDLKPDNVMLLNRDGDPDFVKVLDFGIAKVSVEDQSAQPLTQLGSIFGTPEYMAPEQAQGLPVDGRADLYTLGVLLYEMLAGKTPFIDDDMVVVLTRTLTAEPPPLPEHVEPALQLLVKELLAKSPAGRVQSAAELVSRIDALLDGGLHATSAELLANSGPGSAHAQAVQFSDTVLNIAGPAQGTSAGLLLGQTRASAGISAGLSAHLDRARTLLLNSLTIGGQPVPVWGLAVGGTLVVAVLVLVIVLLAPSGTTEALQRGKAVITEHTSFGGSRVRDLIERANKGDATAIAELHARPDADRGAEEWRALGHGHALVGQYSASVRAYEQALAHDPELGKDTKVFGDVRKACDEPSAASGALALAAKLGPRGADLIYDVWDSNRRARTKGDSAKLARDQLDAPALRAQASPALLVAIELSKPLSCAQYKKIMPRAAESADERSVSALKALTVTRGCGFLGLRDCYSCLRGSKDLTAALKDAPTRPAPSFTAE